MHASRHHQPLSVLVGDDDDAVRACVVELIAARGFRIFTAHDGRESLHILLSKPIDFTILDVHMPDMLGIEVIERYLAGPLVAPPREAPARAARPAIPTIFMSAAATPEIRTRCEHLGQPLLDKPFAPGQLRAEVERILEHLN